MLMGEQDVLKMQQRKDFLIKYRKQSEKCLILLPDKVCLPMLIRAYALIYRHIGICGVGNAFISVSLNGTYYLGPVSLLRGL